MINLSARFDNITEDSLLEYLFNIYKIKKKELEKGDFNFFIRVEGFNTPPLGAVKKY